MNTLKNTLIVILGILVVSSFTANKKKELSNGEKNIELIKKLLKENSFQDVTITTTTALNGNYAYHPKVAVNNISFEDTHILVNDIEKNNKFYITDEGIAYLEVSNDKKGLHLLIIMVR